MSAVTSQPLPFDRLEREKHIQMIFSAFQNRCGPSCQCHRESDEQLSGLAPGRKTEHMHPPRKVKRPGVEEQWPGGAAGSHFMSVLETVSQIHVTARPELQGEQEGLCICVFLWGRFVWFKGMMLCHCRSTVCSQEDLQHHRRRQQVTVNCGCGRYRSSFSYMCPNWAHASCLHLTWSDWWLWMMLVFLVLSLLSESSCVCLQCCGPARACSLQGFDCQGRQVFYFERPLRVDACCLGCCLMEMRAYTPQKHLIGSVCQRYSLNLFLLAVCDFKSSVLYRAGRPKLFPLKDPDWNFKGVPRPQTNIYRTLMLLSKFR